MNDQSRNKTYLKIKTISTWVLKNSSVYARKDCKIFNARIRNNSDHKAFILSLFEHKNHIRPKIESISIACKYITSLFQIKKDTYAADL